MLQSLEAETQITERLGSDKSSSLDYTWMNVARLENITKGSVFIKTNVFPVQGTSLRDLSLCNLRKTEVLIRKQKLELKLFC